MRETTSEGAVSVLVKLLKDEVADVRAYAAEALGKIGSPEAIISMTQALMDKHWYVRQATTRVLTNLELQNTIPVLSQALLDPNPNIRRGAAESLGIIGTRAKDAIPDLVEALKDPASSVRIAAAKALEKIQRAKD